MTPDQFIGYVLLNTTAITTVTSTRINHGKRPTGTVTPCINYYELSGNRLNGMESIVYSINCRASASGQARSLARQVVTLFQGDTGIYGVMNGFTVSRCSLVRDMGLIPEPGNEIFNAPIDISIVFASTTVS